MPLGVVIVNRVLPELFTHADEETFEALREPVPARVLEQHAGPGAAAVLDGGPARGVAAAHAGRSHLDELREQVDLPLLYCRTCSSATTGCASRAWSPTRSAQELGL